MAIELSESGQRGATNMSDYIDHAIREGIRRAEANVLARSDEEKEKDVRCIAFEQFVHNTLSKSFSDAKRKLEGAFSPSTFASSFGKDGEAREARFSITGSDRIATYFALRCNREGEVRVNASVAGTIVEELQLFGNAKASKFLAPFEVWLGNLAEHLHASLRQWRP